MELAYNKFQKLIVEMIYFNNILNTLIMNNLWGIDTNEVIDNIIKLDYINDISIY